MIVGSMVRERTGHTALRIVKIEGVTATCKPWDLRQASKPREIPLANLKPWASGSGSMIPIF